LATRAERTCDSFVAGALDDLTQPVNPKATINITVPAKTFRCIIFKAPASFKISLISFDDFIVTYLKHKCNSFKKFVRNFFEFLSQQCRQTP
jgi:hypothetical protein